MVALTVAALGLWVGLTAFAQNAPQEPLLWARNVAGDSRPIQVNADDAVTWVDQGKRIILLKGKVWVEQGDAHVRAAEAVLWIDEAAKKQNGIYHLDVYGDGGVSLEVQAQSYQAPVAMIELNTRGVVNLKTFKSKVVQQATPDDPLLQRAVAALAAQKAQPKPKQPSALLKNPIQQVSNQEVAALRQAPPQGPVGPEPGPPQPGLPSSPGSAPPVPIVLAPGPPGSSSAVQPPLVPEEGPTPHFSIRPRSSAQPNGREFRMDNGEKATVFSGGVIITITVPISTSAAVSTKGPDEKVILPAPTPLTTPGKDNMVIGPAAVPGKDGRPIEPATKTVEIAADRVVVWTQGDLRELVDGTPAPQGQAPRSFEFYLSGNVEIRDEMIKNIGTPTPIREARVLRCSEGYYYFMPPTHDEPAGRNYAIALNADLGLRQPGLPDPIHVTTPEMHQLTDKLFNAATTQVNASKLPYGPGLCLTTGPASLEQKHIEKKTLFGLQVYKRDTGEEEYVDELLFRASNVVLWLEDVPIFWLPYVQGDARDPLGPLQSISVGYNKVFGFELFTTWNVYDLIGMDPLLGTRWRVGLDYLSARGFEVNTEFGAIGKNLAGISGNYIALVKAMGIDDHGNDILGGNRGEFVTYGYPPPTTTLPITHPELRGRFFGQLNWQELPYNLTVQTQLAVLSDKNFLDQFYNPEWTGGPNQETFAYVKQQENDWALSLLIEPRIRNWITETEWLPKVDGYWIGQDILETLT